MRGRNKRRARMLWCGQELEPCLPRVELKKTRLPIIIQNTILRQVFFFAFFSPPPEFFVCLPIFFGAHASSASRVRARERSRARAQSQEDHFRAGRRSLFVKDSKGWFFRTTTRCCCFPHVPLPSSNLGKNKKKTRAYLTTCMGMQSACRSNVMRGPSPSPPSPSSPRIVP